MITFLFSLNQYPTSLNILQLVRLVIDTEAFLVYGTTTTIKDLMLLEYHVLTKHDIRVSFQRTCYIQGAPHHDSPRRLHVCG